LLPDRCSIKEKGKECPNPPSYVVSIMHESGEYMIGVVCNEHKGFMEIRINSMQSEGKLPKGTIGFTEVKFVGTECVTNFPDLFKT
jgi:hypothetical protein